MLVTHTCVTALIPFCIVMTSVTNINVIPRFNPEAWIDLFSQLWMANSSIVPYDVLDLSKFILMNPPYYFFQNYPIRVLTVGGWTV